MFKRIAVALTLALVGASLAMAAAAKGTIVTIKDNTIVVKVEGALAPWAKKGTTIKIDKKVNGKIVEVTDTTITITSRKAGELKVGGTVTFDKSLAIAGC